MKKFKLIFYIIYFVYVLVSIIFITYNEPFTNRYGLSGVLTIFKYWIIISTVFVLVLQVRESVHHKKLKNKIKRLEKDNHLLKAELYDREQNNKDTDPEAHEA